MHAQQIDIAHGLLFSLLILFIFFFFATLQQQKTLQPIIHNMVSSSTDNILKGMTTLYA